MKIVKLFVILCFFRSIQGRYCEICNNHTLCKYAMEGPSPVCVSYDKAALLTNKDTTEIVNRINERRQLVAMGLLNQFPQAANMKKMRWSSKLASFAQRWVDQCDRSVKPDKEDECRDLVSMKVGQNIATVLGPSPGLGVKSFVDIWFMLNIHFMGSVAYYNQSKNSKGNYFTQLIWADTTFVGCGRAKFFVDILHTVVERLVCNFAPRGNIHEKPIYIIGYPGTQCSNQMLPDREFPGLCLQTTESVFHNNNFIIASFCEELRNKMESDNNLRKLLIIICRDILVSATKNIDKGSSASSLLRILNLSNNSLKQELDPNNLKQMNLNSSEINDQRNQKTRHVYLNNSYGAVKRDSIHLQNPVRNMENFNEPQYTQRIFTQERGHSRMYHGYQSSKEPIYNQDMSHTHTEHDFRRSDYATSAPFYSSATQDARKHYVDSQCTRRMISGENHNSCFSPDPPCKTKTNECTRGQAHNCPQPIPCQHTTFARLDKACGPCNEQTPPTAANIQCDCNQKCLPTSKCQAFTTTYCPYRKVGGDEPDQSNPFGNYDPFHNLEVKSGDEELSRKELWGFENADKLDKTEYSRKESDPYKQVKSIVDESRPKIRKIQDSYRSFDYSERKKRGDLEDQTFKPFWQMDEYNIKWPSELKSIRYTTLVNKRHRKTRATVPTTRLPTSTETITIKPKDKSSVHYNNRGRVTEKYLSFDELMHLRKLSTAESKDNDARRRADSDALRQGATTVDPSKTTTMTANTPFIRQKHCTRKLTCTWTAAINGSGGDGGGGGGAFDVGSRTPPGYVDGCTRTSTCTRDYMDRNKMATLSESPDATTLEDEDYCERRSLNIRRRNLEEHEVTILSIVNQEAYTKLPILNTKLHEIVSSLDDLEVETSSQIDNFHCICYEDATRVKRGEINAMKSDLNSNGLQYSDDCSKHKISRSKNNIISYKCPCNGTISLRNIMFYRAITLRYSVTWMFYYTFIMRSLEG